MNSQREDRDKMTDSGEETSTQAQDEGSVSHVSQTVKPIQDEFLGREDLASTSAFIVHFLSMREEKRRVQTVASRDLLRTTVTAVLHPSREQV